MNLFIIQNIHRLKNLLIFKPTTNALRHQKALGINLIIFSLVVRE